MNTRTLLLAPMGFVFITNLFGGSRVDLSTPERAVQSLEDAWRAKDLEKAVRCKDFRGEAEQVLRDKPAAVRSEDIIAQMAQVLEMGYRAEIKKSGFPNRKDVTSTFSGKRQLSPDRFELAETFRFPDGTTHAEKVQVRRTKDGWKAISAP